MAGNTYDNRDRIMLRRRDLLAAGGFLTTFGWLRETMASQYPAPKGLPGAPFEDPNLKLAILSGLIDKQVVDLGTPRQLAEHVLGRPVDLEKEGYEQIPAVRAYLDRYPLTPDLLRQVDGLVLDGGNSAYPYVWFFWDGEDESFNVTSLSGIGHCPNIKSLDLTSMIETVDLRDLLPPFQIENINAGVELVNVPALLDMPNLKSVRILDDQLYGEVMTPDHPNRQVMETLKAKGVSVWIHWMASDDGSRPAYQ
ncbi:MULTISPECIES: DUF6892 domain-containing protein [Rhizobium/Agrobacterium group]|nr:MULTISPECIES: hypothetical protein [Rhizobium/Agrobacterium group]NIB58269.1 hypothetical protein [Agrobacterium tumefaciens]NSZ23010.1 hypothetical protein [Agrobacterium tumefaciens]NTB19095.1 hypothetical protein [Agrobacterium tumefaciens]QQE36914.1 hypothetical protein I6I05_27440 [Agrobacterium tumefaciens]